MIKNRRRFPALILLLAASAGTAQAQGERPGLQDITGLKCEFPVIASGTWAADGVASGQVKAATRTLAFTKIDAQDGSAEAVGALGQPLIVVQLSGGYLHFMQVGPTGFLYVTTVINRPARPGRLKAVHTRHEYTEITLPGYTSRPEQYYGDCEAQR